MARFSRSTSSADSKTASVPEIPFSELRRLIPGSTRRRLDALRRYKALNWPHPTRSTGSLIPKLQECNVGWSPECPDSTEIKALHGRGRAIVACV